MWLILWLLGGDDVFGRDNTWKDADPVQILNKVKADVASVP